MKKLIYMVFALVFLVSCGSSKKNQNDVKTKDTVCKPQDSVVIKSDETDFELIVFDPRFAPWLESYAKPRDYYSQSYLEERNRLFVIEWNMRVMRPQIYDPNLYSITIDYDSKENYGYEVNYLLYHYFIYFQIMYNQKFAGFVPRP